MLGLIGRTLSHSFSAEFFNEKFDREDIDESYHLFPLGSIKDFPILLANHPELRGLNVTIPYKQDIISYLDSISEEVREIGAVNIIKISKRDSGTYLEGFNSDYIGFRDSLVPLLRPDIKRALILGTGGASKAVAFVLKTLGIDYKYVSRTPSPGDYSYQDLSPQVIDKHLLIDANHSDL